MAMSDEELERLRKRRFVQLSNRFLTKKEERKEVSSKKELLNEVFIGRAGEVFNATQAQYPQIAEKLGEVLLQLALSGKIKHVTGEELYYLLRKMGLRVKLNTKIRIQEHGKMKSIEDKMKE
jgi:DNA-binding TFAR19-related protein (PDSD5 family)